MDRLRPLLCALLIILLQISAAGASAVTVAFTYPESEKELVNPYMGSAAWASDASEREQPFTLVYANLLWSDFEPDEGVYDFQTFEKANHFEKWRGEGKHLILRFVMDQPGSKSHRDIPDWLYVKTGKDGQAYKTSYGRGYSPNYENPVLIDAHEKAIAALGERYGQDPFVAYVELGSLGHWGEWHVFDKLHPLPLSAVRDLYTAPYLHAFPSAKLMMRRPFFIAAQNSLGLYNDASGDVKATETWLSWIENGGAYNQTGEVSALSPMADAWRFAPIGGELTTSASKTELLGGGRLEQTLRLFSLSHTTWIGPGSFVDVKRGGEYQEALDTVNKTIGYRLRVASCEVSQAEDGKVEINLTWINSGIAPFYFGWIPSVKMIGEDGSETVWPLDMRLEDVLPYTAVSVKLSLDKAVLPKGMCTVYAGIVDPGTKDAGIELAMDTVRQGDWYELLQLRCAQEE